MKKIIVALICLLFFAISYAQKISEPEARQYLEKVWGYLKISDSTAFVNLWLPEDSVWQKLHTPLEGMKLYESFKRLKHFLAPVEQMDIDKVLIGQEDARGTEITAEFQAREHAVIGFSFYVAPVSAKWTARGKPNINAMSK